MASVVDRSSATAFSVEQAARRYLTVASQRLLGKATALGLDRPRPEAPADSLALTGEEPPWLPHYHNFIRHGEAFLQAGRQRMIEATQAHERSVGDDRRRRERREQARVSAYETLKSIRLMVAGALGPGAVEELLGIIGRTPQNVMPLLSRLAHAVRKLEQADRSQFPPLRIDGVADLSWDGMLARLRAEHDELLEATNAVGEDGRDFDVTLLAKQDAIDEFTQLYIGWARVLEGLLLVGGLPNLADKLRPTIPRRPGSGEGGDELPLPEEPLPEEPSPEEPLPLPGPEDPEGPPGPEDAPTARAGEPPRPRLVPPNGGGGAA